MNARKVKVIFLTCRLSGGGAERSLLEVFRALDRNHFAPMLWRLGKHNMYPEYLTKSHETSVLAPLPGNASSTARIKRYCAKLPRYLKNIQAETLMGGALRVFDRLRKELRGSSDPVILVSSQLSMNVYSSIVQWLVRYRVPVVLIEQNEPYLRYKSVESRETKDLAWRRIRQMYPRATHIVVVSDAAKKSLVLRFGVARKRITVIPNPVNFRKLRVCATQRPPVHPFYDGHTPVIVCAARFHPLKNHQMLLRSFALVKKHSRAKLILIGQGALQEAVRRSIEDMGLDNDVSVIDFRSRPFSFVAHADLSVLASYSEGQGLSVVESLACGVPVVCTNWPGVEELIHDGVNGTICQMNDKALAAGLFTGLQLAKSKATRMMATASAEKFDVSKIISKYKSLLSKLAK